jgi:hypothetical protein
MIVIERFARKTRIEILLVERGALPAAKINPVFLLCGA